MAQLVARLVRNEKVRGSNPLSSTRTDTIIWCPFRLPPLPPHCPRHVEALQTGPTVLCSEEVQVAVRGRDRLVNEPCLDRPGVDATRQPQAGGSAAAVRDPTPAAGRVLPVEGPHDSAPVQRHALIGRAEQVGRTLALAQVSDDGHDPISQGAQATTRALFRLHADPLRIRAADEQARRGHLHRPRPEAPASGLRIARESQRALWRLTVLNSRWQVLSGIQGLVALSGWSMDSVSSSNRRVADPGGQ